MKKAGVSSTASNLNLKDGTPRQRILRACNACRSHKARCDGRTICETCRRYDRACNYQIPPVDHSHPAQKIRALEDSLVKAKHHIEDLQRQLAEDLASHSEYKPSAQSAKNDFQTVQTAGEIRHGTARSTGLGLIEALLKPLSHHDDIRRLTRSKGSGEFLRNTPLETKPFFTELCQLPVHAAMIGSACAAFEGIFGLCNVVVEQDFFTTAQALYDSHPMSYTEEHADFMPLFFSVIALGMICRTNSQKNNDPDDNLKESQFYFAAASASVKLHEEHLPLTKVQAGLCIVLYLVNTSKPDLARHYIHAITSFSTVQNLLRDMKRDESSVQPLDRPLMASKQLLWLTCYLDMYVSGLLGLNPLLDPSISTLTATAAIDTAARNVTVFKRSDTGFLFEVSLGMAVELQRLMHSARTEVLADVDQNLTSVKKEHSAEEVPEFSNSAHTEFATWEQTFRCIFSEDDNNPRIALAQNELRMHYFLAQIVILHGHLVHHSQSPDTDDLSRLEHICKGRACVIAASNAILFTAERAERMQMISLTWLSAYTVFISAITLMTAIAILEDTNTQMREAMERTIQIAFHILKYSTYNASEGKSTYTDFLGIVSSRVNVELEHAPADSITTYTETPSYGSESVQPGSSTISSATPSMMTDTGTMSSLSERWWQQPNSEPKSDDWGFD